MLQDVNHCQEQLSIDEITSPLSVQIFDFCYPELFQESLLRNSEATSGLNPNRYDDKSSFTKNNNNDDDVSDKISGYQDNMGSNTSTETANNNNNNGDLSIVFDPQDEFENDISASIDFSSSFPSQDQFHFSAVEAQNVLYPSSVDSMAVSAGSIGLNPMIQTAVFEEDRLPSFPIYSLGPNPASPLCSFLGPTGLPASMSGVGNISSEISVESSGIFSGNVLLGSEFHLPDDQLEFHGDNGGIFCDSIHRAFNPGDLRAIFGGGGGGGGGGSGQSQNQVVATAVADPPPAPPPLGTEITGLDDSTFNKVGKLSVEQRKEKIHRYMKKRNERNFSKKIKYACRKTLADSRPRVRGRFAKNDEFGEAHRQASSSHHEEDDDYEVVVKEEDNMVDASDIFAQISGVNSFKCNNPIPSWI